MLPRQPLVRHDEDAGESARDVLHAFDRWPTWMWANEEVAELVEWLRQHNDQAAGHKAGFYGLDVYSLWDSLYQILGYLGKHGMPALPAAQRAVQCFEPYGEDVQDYARATHWVGETCEDEVWNWAVVCGALPEARNLSRCSVAAR